MSTVVHPTAIIENGALLGSDVYVGPYCTIAKGARIGNGTRLQSHVVIDGITEIGENNTFFPFCVIGAPPQDLSYKDEPTKTIIGNRNVFRESCTVHRGTTKDRLETRIGNDGYFMGFVHFAHDCLIGDRIIVANQTCFAGHVVVEDDVVISGQVGVGQWVRIGAYAFIAGGAAVRKDVAPYLCVKDFSDVSGPNLVGLRRQKVGAEDVRIASEIYKILYLGNLTTEKALGEIEARFGQAPFAKRFTDFVRQSKVGIQR